MKVTKYPQSCFIFEKNGKKILIDHGMFCGENFPVQKFLDVSAVLTTHTHRDHMNLDALKEFSNSGIKLYGNFDVVKAAKESGLQVIEVKDREAFSIENFKVESIFLPHCKILRCNSCNEWLKPKNFIPGTRRCKLHPNEITSEMDGPPNTGFLIDGIFFHPGDGIEIKNFEAKKVGVPIAGPTITYERAWQFAKSLNSEFVIAMHYDNTYAPAQDRDPQKFLELKPKDFKGRALVLKDGESIEL